MALKPHCPSSTQVPVLGAAGHELAIPGSVKGCWVSGEEFTHFLFRQSLYVCVCGAVCFLCFSMCSGVVGRLQDMWTGCRSVAKRMRGKQAEQDGVEEDVPGPEESQAEEDDADDGNDESGMQEEQGEEEQEKEQNPSIDPEGDEPLKRPAANPSKKLKGIHAAG